jgi:hypothetical protein
MKLHYCGFLSFCLLLSALLLSSPLRAAFEIDIHINGAENPSLTFGEVDQGDATRSPFPPYSGMFGVVDVCFAGAAGAEQWFDRLGEDIKVAADNNTWILVAKSNARLTFNLQEGGTPGELYIVYNDVKTGARANPVQLSDGASFSVKTGGVYTITRDSGADPEDNPQGANSQFVAKDGTGEADFEPKDDGGNPFTLEKIKISFVSGRGIVAYTGEDVTEREPPITEDEVDWWFSVSREGYEVAYNWTIPYTELEVTLTPIAGGRGTRADDDLKVSMEPTRSAAPPITTTLDFLDELGAKRLTKTIDWILQKFGTLDFDGDGDIDINDVMYLYNFLANGGATGALDFSTDEEVEAYNISLLLNFTSKNPDNPDDMDDARTAMGIFRTDVDSLKFDGSAGELNINDIMYFYNFLANGGASGVLDFSTDEEVEAYNISLLLNFTSKDPDNPEDMAAAQAAMQTLRDYKSNL